MSRSVFLWARDVLIALAVAIILMQFIKPTIVREHSMEDTLHPDDYILLAKQAYTFGDVKYGDVVVFRSDLETETGAKKNLIKRVIGLPGDTISVSDGLVYRNGEPLDEPYIKDGITSGEMDTVTVEKNRMFVMGDNRDHSTDSRTPSVGTVSMDTLAGKAILRVFPFKSFGSIKSAD
jgi:signal peptidase I